MEFLISDHCECEVKHKKANVEIQMKTANRNDWLLFPLWPSPSLHRRHTLGKNAIKGLQKKHGLYSGSEKYGVREPLKKHFLWKKHPTKQSYILQTYRSV